MYKILTPEGPIESKTKGEWGGHKKQKIYGRLDCPAALRAIAKGGYVKSRVFFLTEADAKASGYRPCAVCLRQKYDAWKAAQTERQGERQKVLPRSRTRRGGRR